MTVKLDETMETQVPSKRPKYKMGVGVGFCDPNESLSGISIEKKRIE